MQPGDESTLDGAREAQPTASRRRERRASGKTGAVLAVVIGLVGLGLCVFGGLAYLDAAKIDDDAAAVASERHALEASEQEARDHTLAIQTASNDVNTAIRRVIAASNEFIAAGRAVTDAANGAVALLNQGNPAGARSAFATAVGPAVADHEAKLPAVNDAPANLQAAIDALQRTLDG